MMATAVTVLHHQQAVGVPSQHPAGVALRIQWIGQVCNGSLLVSFSRDYTDSLDREKVPGSASRITGAAWSRPPLEVLPHAGPLTERQAALDLGQRVLVFVTIT